MNLPELDNIKSRINNCEHQNKFFLVSKDAHGVIAARKPFKVNVIRYRHIALARHGCHLFVVVII
jgi:hypothetical protein